jgi:hypothetical protein
MHVDPRRHFFVARFSGRDVGPRRLSGCNQALGIATFAGARAAEDEGQRTMQGTITLLILLQN